MMDGSWKEVGVCTEGVGGSRGIESVREGSGGLEDGRRRVWI